MSIVQDDLARTALRTARGQWRRVMRVRQAYARTRSPEQVARFTAHCRAVIRSGGPAFRAQ